MAATAKWAVITGSSSGLGYGMAARLLEQGWNVAGGSRSGTEIEHPNFYDLELDVTDPAAVEEFYRTLAGLTRQVDLFVQNAGAIEMGALAEASAEWFEKHYAVNAFGPFLMLQGARPFLRPGAHVVSVLSTAAKYGYPHVAAYSAAKFAQRGMLESLQKEWKDLKLRFTPLYPGAIDTPLWDGVGKEFSRERMLTLEDFLYVFDFVVNAPENIRIADLTFLHKDGFLE